MTSQRLNPADLDLNAFKSLINQPVEKPALAAEVISKVPVYDANDLDDYRDPAGKRATLLDEWAEVLLNGAGVFAICNATQDPGVIDRASDVLLNLIEQEKQAQGGGGDHFAAAGNNDRLWNSLEKHALADPASFISYYANPWIAAAAEAWLGPRYQVTAQVNLVHPGGKPQTAHRDYHLGFMPQAGAAQFPQHVHDLTAALTLQGAIAHVDMSLESGPTKLLPHSQKYALGYLAFHEQSFRDAFEDAYVQVPLNKGDLLWFNPALFHAAGENRTTDVHRLVNLFQISSAFGRPMETVDRTAMVQKIEPKLADANLTSQALQDLVSATAQGYAFPTNLDENPPVGGLAPATDYDRLLGL